MNNLNFVLGIFHLEVLVVMEVVEVILTITNKIFEAILIYAVKTSNNLKVHKLHHIFVFYNCLNLSKMQDYNNEWFPDVLKVT